MGDTRISKSESRQNGAMQTPSEASWAVQMLLTEEVLRLPKLVEAWMEKHPERLNSRNSDSNIQCLR